MQVGCKFISSQYTVITHACMQCIDNVCTLCLVRPYPFTATGKAPNSNSWVAFVGITRTRLSGVLTCYSTRIKAKCSYPAVQSSRFKGKEFIESRDLVWNRSSNSHRMPTLEHKTRCFSNKLLSL